MVIRCFKPARPNRKISGDSPVVKPILFFLISFMILGGCGKPAKSGEVEELEFTGMEQALTKWEDVFEKTGEFKPVINKPGLETFTMGVIYTIWNRRVIIRDLNASGLHEFDDQFHYVRSIGKKGPGPGEYLLPVAAAFNDKGDFFVFDVGKFRLIKYLAPDFRHDKDIIVSQVWQDYIFTPDHRMIAYTSRLDRSDNLELLDESGQALTGGFEAPDKRFHVFQSRFKTGKMCKISGNEFVMTYPLDYSLHFFDMNLKRTRLIKAARFSAFMPSPLEFPARLAPDDYHRDHAEWWEKTVHPSRVMLLKKNILAVQLLKYSKQSPREFVNIHDLRGKTPALGLEVPDEGVIHGSLDDTLIVVREEGATNDNEVREPVIIKYKLRI